MDRFAPPQFDSDLGRPMMGPERAMKPADAKMEARGTKTMEDQNDRDGVGRADRVSKLYIAFGVPGIIMFIVVLFALTRWFGIPA
ncbi:MAG: hypothetical protein VCE43_01280 [Myxococcota bacterium]